jgi:colicin import membrane protein
MITDRTSDINGSLNDKFAKYFSLALGFHGFLILLGLGLSFIIGLNVLSTEESKKNLKIIQSSVRVDVVAMPKFTVQELKKMKVEAPIPEVKGERLQEKEAQDIIKKDDIVIKKVKKKIDLSNLLANLGKKEKKIDVKKGSKDRKIDLESRRQLKKLILEGNKVSAGTSTVGSTTSLDQTRFSQYVSALPNFIRPYWKLPSYLMDKELKCRIRLFIASNGKILNSEIYESSGVDEFDQKALQALTNISSFPKPEGEIVSRLAAGEVLLGFPL